jgi:ABC-type dipeptide/oligopeptide/nickel transport system permease component
VNIHALFKHPRIANLGRWRVFSWLRSIPGIGREVILAVERSDFPVIKAITVYVAFATILSNLLADQMYKAVDPRVQLK